MELRESFPAVGTATGTAPSRLTWRTDPTTRALRYAYYVVCNDQVESTLASVLHTATLLHCTAPLHSLSSLFPAGTRAAAELVLVLMLALALGPGPWALALAKQSGRPRLVARRAHMHPACFHALRRCAIPSAARDSTHQSPISVPEPTPPWPAHTPAHVCTLTARPSASASRLRLVCAPATAHPPANELAAERRTACTCKHHLPADLSMRFPKSKHPVAQPNITTTHTSQQ